MGNSVGKKLALILLSLSVAGCAGLSKQDSSTDSASIPRSVEDLSGSWEYVDSNGTFTLTLNKRGKGTYEWKNGRIETEELTNGVWTGKWYQTENDREGGFRLRLSPGSPLADGVWWYTRIGKDHAPLEPGGTFALRRIPPMGSKEK